MMVNLGQQFKDWLVLVKKGGFMITVAPARVMMANTLQKLVAKKNAYGLQNYPLGD
tara:strand:- start:241 stop:408 length:168 start_codon:yes stop_codon:yes gene_type:complete